MNEHFDNLCKELKKLPSVGFRSAQRIALNLILENPENAKKLGESIFSALENIKRCPVCGNLCSSDKAQCIICSSLQKDHSKICIVEKISDLEAIEKSGVWKGLYHILHGKLSPVNNIAPEDINLQSLSARLSLSSKVDVVFALSNDMESEATCHYIEQEILMPLSIKPKRIRFGLPSGSMINYVDSQTLSYAFENL